MFLFGNFYVGILGAVLRINQNILHIAEILRSRNWLKVIFEEAIHYSLMLI